MTAPLTQHRPGRLRFCGWLCHDGYREDRRHGLLTLPRSFAEAGCCLYCGAPVPTNAERRALAHGLERECQSCGARTPCDQDHDCPNLTISPERASPRPGSPDTRSEADS